MYNNRRDWRLRLSDIRDSIERIHRYVQGMDFDTFREDERTIDAVVRNFEIIGEASRYVPDEFKSSHSHIPWQEMRRMRNKVAHAYFDVNVSIVWDTIVSDLPTLLSQISEITESQNDA